MPTTSFAHQPHDPVVAVAFSPTFGSDRTIFVATSDVTVTLQTRLLLRSTDGGLTWRVVPNFPNVEVAALTLSPTYASDGTLFAATRGGGLLRSTDQGSTWSDVGGPLGADVLTVTVTPDYASDQTVYAANAQGGMFKSSTGGTTWQALLVAPTIPIVDTIALSPAYTSDQTLFVGTTTQGVFRSINGGTSWVAANNGIGHANIASLALSPAFASDRRVFAATRGGGIFVSANAGAGWVAANNGIGTSTGDRVVASLAVSPTYASDHSAFAATASGKVFRTEDGGVTWARSGATQRELTDQTDVHYRAIGISPNFGADRTLLLATFEGLWRSRNAAASWVYQELLPAYLVRSLSAAPDMATSGTLIGATYGGGVVQTADGGQSWETRNTGLYGGYPDPTDTSPAFANDRTAFVGTVYGPQRSTDGGLTWQLFPMLGVPVFSRAVAVSPDFTQDRTVAIGTDNLGTGHPAWTTYKGQQVKTDGLFISRDGGENWAPTGINGTAVHSIAFSPGFSADGTMFAASLYTGVHKSTDRGATWTKLSGAFGACCVARVALSPAYSSDQTLFITSVDASSDRRGLYRSTDGGATWVRVATTEALTILDVGVSPAFASDRTLFIATLERGLLRSTNGGGTLTAVNLRGAYVTALEVSPAFATDRTLFAATYSGISRSVDGGATWQALTTKTRVEEDRPSIVRTGVWDWETVPGSSASLVLASAEPAASLSYTFVGTRIRWLGNKGPASGTARILLDGNVVSTVDLHESVPRLQQVLYESPELRPGEHTITVIVTGEHAPQSAGALVVLDAFDIWR